MGFSLIIKVEWVEATWIFHFFIVFEWEPNIISPMEIANKMHSLILNSEIVIKNGAFFPILKF